MMVCSCKVVADRAIEEAIGAGAKTVKEVLQKTGAASECGRCGETVKQMLDERRDGYCKAPGRNPYV